MNDDKFMFTQHKWGCGEWWRSCQLLTTRYPSLMLEPQQQRRHRSNCYYLLNMYSGETPRELSHVCTLLPRYHGERETGMSVVDVGLFTGYKPVESDLKNVSNSSSFITEPVYTIWFCTMTVDIYQKSMKPTKSSQLYSRYHEEKCF